MRLKSKIQGWLTSRVSAEYLLARYQKTGSNHYLTLLVEQFNRPLYHYLTSMTDKALAEDVLQSTWLTVVQKSPTVNEYVNVKSWLFTIARHRLIDELRYKNRWRGDSFDECTHSAELSGTIESVIIKNQHLDQFNRAIAKMPLMQREAFIFQQEGFSINDISQLTNSEPEAVKSRLRYARQHLKKSLGKLK